MLASQFFLNAVSTDRLVFLAGADSSSRVPGTAIGLRVTEIPRS